MVENWEDKIYFVRGGYKMDRIILIRPNKSLEQQAISYKKEHFDYGENTINGSEMWDKTESYDEWLKEITNNTDIKTVNPYWVVTDTFFAIREIDYKIIGIIDFRHELNDFLKDFGHIGYSVRPSERKKGYATEMLKQLLEIARQTGLSEVHLSCEKENIPSIKTILKNGASYERSFLFEDKEANVYVVRL